MNLRNPNVITLKAIHDASAWVLTLDNVEHLLLDCLAPL
jgi:hypothetical protein